MTLTPFTGTTSITTLRSNFDDATATLTANALLGQKDWEIAYLISTMSSTTDISLRSVPFTLDDDAQIRCIFISGTCAAGIVKISLVQDATTDLTFLLGTDVSATLTNTGSARTTYTSTGSTTLRALAGVRYRLQATVTSGTWTNTSIVLQLRSRRRRA